MQEEFAATLLLRHRQCYMEILEVNNEEREITLQRGEKRHVVLINPQDAVLNIKQLKDSELKLHCVKFSEQPSFCKINISQEESSCRSQLYGLAVLQSKCRFDLSTHLFHNIGGGYSEQLVKFLLDDNSYGSFYGKLIIAKDAQQTEAHQTNRNILISPTARMDTMPQLEIYADDVKASHGATTGQLDAQALFYMQQRGIPLSVARKMLLEAFIQDIIQDLPEELVLPLT